MSVPDLDMAAMQAEAAKIQAQIDKLTTGRATTTPHNVVPDYIAHGWKLCAIPPSSKGTRTPGWNTEENALKSADDLPAGYGVGLLHAYSNTCSIDLDDLFMAQMMFAERGIDLQALLDAPDAVQVVSGRPGSGKLLYRLDTPLPSKKLNIGVKTILEFRCATADGLTVQDVLPPSRHPSGTTYTWAGSGSWQALPTLPPAILAWWQELLAEKPHTTSSPQKLDDLTEVKDALQHISADCHHDLWIEIVMALNSTGNPEAYEIAKAWSKTAPHRYPGDREFDTRWRSFKDKAITITIASLFYRAKEHGWVRPMPDHTAMFNYVPTLSREMQREQARRIGEGDEFDEFPEVLSVQQMLERFVFLADGSRTFDTLHPAHVLAFNDFKNLTSSNATLLPTGEFGRDGKEKMKRVPNAQIWMMHKSRQSAISTTFKAGGDLFVSDPNGRNCVNLWGGYRQGELAEHFAVEPLFVSHIRWLFKDRADDFLDWLAHIQQHPDQLPHTAWLHISSHTGTGRNWVASLLARVFAGHVAAALDLVHILEKGFNERLSRKVLAIVDEIRVGGKDQWQHAETMKQMITAEVRNINVKYGRESLEFNACRFLLFSNHRSAIPIDDNDRRVEVVISDNAPRSGDYYTQLYAALDDPMFVRGVAWWLAQRDLSKFNPGRHAKRDAAKLQVIHMSTPDALLHLQEFNSIYPCPLATADRLKQVTGMAGIGSNAKLFANILDDGGWIRIGKMQLKGGSRPTIYARKEVAMDIDQKGNGPWISGNLPVVDGGSFDWDAPPISRTWF